MKGVRYLNLDINNFEIVKDKESFIEHKDIKKNFKLPKKFPIMSMVVLTIIILGCLFATMLCVFASFVSGVVFFGQYAPQGMNVYLYSFIYNYSSGGVEGILSTILMSLLPINRFRKIALSNNNSA